MIKPILFNTVMVQAILEGRKTCTRRVVKGNIKDLNIIGSSSSDGVNFNSVSFGYGNINDIKSVEIKERVKAPYMPGDILYVRETWNLYDGAYYYRADEGDWFISDYNEKINLRWKPSIHMPKAAARVFLKVTDVRVERLNDITEDGAKAEGATKQIWYQPYGTRNESNQKYVGDIIHQEPNYITGFAGIWDNTLQKPDGWLYSFREDPYVWVIEFERINTERINRYKEMFKCDTETAINKYLKAKNTKVCLD